MQFRTQLPSRKEIILVGTVAYGIGRYGSIIEMDIWARNLLLQV
jgi:hypothetical protein